MSFYVARDREYCRQRREARVDWSLGYIHTVARGKLVQCMCCAMTGTGGQHQPKRCVSCQQSETTDNQKAKKCTPLAIGELLLVI
jgi:hypothetical protein